MTDFEKYKQLLTETGVEFYETKPCSPQNKHSSVLEVFPSDWKDKDAIAYAYSRWKFDNTTGKLLSFRIVE